MVTGITIKLKMEKKMKLEYKWTCKICDEQFKTRRLLQEHKNKNHENFYANKHKFAGYHKIINKPCQYCGYICKLQSSLTLHEKHCSKNPNGIHKTCNKETKTKISNALKMAIKEGRAKGWASSKQNKNGMSYPEIWFEKVIENENLDKNYEYNKQFFQYKIDFAWVDKKLAFEIDGEQHNLPERIESDIKKDAKLKEFGWKVLRLKWSYIYNNTKEFIKIIKDFLNETGNINVPNWKSKTEIKNENREQKNKIIYKKWLDRKELILKSGVDFSKYGWKTKVEKITNLTRREIENTIKHFKEDFKNCFKRK